MPAFVGSLSVFGLGAGAFPLAVIGLSSWSMFRNTQLVLSQQGLVFPQFCNLTLLGRRNRSWYDLKSIEMIGDSAHDDYRRKKLRLRYKSGGFVTLPLAAFPAADLEQILIGIETFADQSGGKELLLPLKRSLKNELRIEGKKSYTNLWEDELRYRYASTTFIPLSPGSLLQEGQIKVLRQLGFGGLSAIYLVQRNNKEMAILKESVLPADVDAELRAKAEEQFQREARILAGLNHPQIAKVLDHFVERGHYLLLEYVHGQDLRQHLNERTQLSEKTVIKYSIQIAEILDYLHKRQPSIIHRDLTPENLIVADNGKIVLIDFGAANEFLHTATGTLVGKHAYMAPEQLRGKAATQSDLYSLGGTMHFLLTGKDPVPLAPSRPRSLNESISEEMDQLVFKLTQTAKEDRYETAASVKKALMEIVASGMKT